MESRSINDLKADPKNPRTISKADFQKLKELLKEYGDLSGIVKNLTTGELVGGHMRVNAFREMGSEASIQITQRFDTPTRTGTTAIGYVTMDGEMYTYREVQWPREKQSAANIAANRAGGDFDKDLLAQVTYELSQLENGAELLAMTGMLDDETKKLIDMVAGEPDINLPDGDKPGFQTMSFTLSDEQAEVISEAIGNIKATKSFDGMENQNSNGNALYFVARDYLDRLHGLSDEPS